MSSRTLAISATVHLGLAASLLFVAGSRQAREAISIAVFSEKKKAAPPKPSPKPASPRPVSPRRPEAVPPPAAAQPVAPTPESAPAPVALESLELSSDDVAGAVVIPVQRRPTAAPQKVAMITAAPPSERRRRGSEQDDRCDEPPTKPEPTYRVEIEFLAQARAEGVEGRLVLRIHVAPDGTVEKVEILSPVHPALDAAAVATVMRWRFRPATACGRPAPSVYTVARKFELGD